MGLIVCTIELHVKFLKEEWKHGLDPSLKKLSMSSLARCVSKSDLKVG